ncbi:MAG: hypothetical protein QME52_05015 [Bacteroidota bacterium]|nr:hypothetical protein [Bacteroidota bacterium]
MLYYNCTKRFIFARLILIGAVLFVNNASCSTLSDETSGQKNPKNRIEQEIKQDTLNLPNYTRHKNSPTVENLGVALVLSTLIFKKGEPVIVHGAYNLNQQDIRKAEGLPLTRIMLIVVRRDEPDICSHMLQDASNINPMPIQSAQKDDPTYREGGYFNVNAWHMCEFLNKPGKYWIMASIGDYVSNRIEFEIVTK